jgi:hypothetical protein
MAQSAEKFAQLLTEGVRRIAIEEDKNISVIQDELGYLLGREGRSAIDYWRRGFIPSNLSDVETLAREIVKRGHLEPEWLRQFLDSTDYPNPENLCAELFPSFSQNITQQSIISATASQVHHLPRIVSIDWGEAPDVGNFCGREKELNQLEEWIVTDKCRLIAVLGMGGIGKTALSTKLGEQVKEHFDLIIWRSLRIAPPLEEFLKEFIRFLSSQPLSDIPSNINNQILMLLNCFREHRCLLVLDNFEGILGGNDRAGHYRDGYEERSYPFSWDGKKVQLRYHTPLRKLCEGEDNAID